MKRFSLLPLAILLAAATIESRAATSSINPSVDALVTNGPSNSLSNNNYGGAGALGISAPGSAKGEFQSLLRFDLSGVVSGFNTQFGAGQWVIDSVSLRLTATPPVNSLFNASAAGSYAVQWMANDSWVEGTGSPMAPTTDGVTFALLPSYLSGSDTALGIFNFDGTTSGNRTAALSLATSFTSDLAAGGLVSLRLFAADTAVSYLVNSQNFGTAASRPLLTISASAVPEPSAALLLVSGLAFVTGRKRRHAPAA